MPSFPERLKELRKINKTTQAQLAKEIGINERTCRRHEASDVEPTLSVIIAMANYFNVSIDYLVGRSNDPKRY